MIKDYENSHRKYRFGAHFLNAKAAPLLAGILFLAPLGVHALDLSLQEIDTPAVKAEALEGIISTGRPCPSISHVWTIIQNGKAQQVFKVSCSNNADYQLTIVGDALYVKVWTGEIFGAPVDERPTSVYRPQAPRQPTVAPPISYPREAPSTDGSSWSIPWTGLGLAIVLFASFAFIYARHSRPRRRLLSGDGATVFQNRAPQVKPAPPPVVPVTSAVIPKAPPATLPDDPITETVAGRLAKRALWDVEALIEQDGVVELFKLNGYRIAGEKNIWQHPTGIYLVCPPGRQPRVFSRVADARKYRDQPDAAHKAARGA